MSRVILDSSLEQLVFEVGFSNPVCVTELLYSNLGWNITVAEY